MAQIKTRSMQICSHIFCKLFPSFLQPTVIMMWMMIYCVVILMILQHFHFFFSLSNNAFQVSTSRRSNKIFPLVVQLKHSYTIYHNSEESFHINDISHCKLHEHWLDSEVQLFHFLSSIEAQAGVVIIKIARLHRYIYCR